MILLGREASKQRKCLSVAATILTSNLHFDEWGAAFAANKMIGAATLDRLRHGAYKIVLEGESYRALPPASEKSKPPADKGRKTA